MRPTRSPRLLVPTGLAVAALLGTAACGSTTPTSAPARHQRAPHPGHSASATPTTPSSSPSSPSDHGGSGAGSGPAYVSGPSTGSGSTAGTTEVLGIRTGSHAGYDRMVVDLKGAAPAWRAQYQRHFHQDGSGKPVDLHGQAGLQVTLQAAGHDQNYQPVYTGPRRADPQYPALRQWAVTGDFEGQFSVGLALGSRAPYRVFTLSSPTRLVIDVKQ